MSSYARRLGGLIGMLGLAGCGLARVQDCDSALGNNDLDTARLRTSRNRMLVENPAEAAARVLLYARMSEFAYVVTPGCDDRTNPDKVSAERKGQLLSSLTPAWNLEPDLGPKDGCEDKNTGLMYHVWYRREGDRSRVVIAFRGTSETLDWIRGNLWWGTRFLYKETQYEQVDKVAARVTQFYRDKATAGHEEPPMIYATGHSLGGGLAQRALYSQPQDIRQAIVFDPSAVTGSAGVDDEQFEIACNCADLYPETRFLRVYENYEVLSILRIFHKTFLGPERHVQELRFSFEGGNFIGRHGMGFFSAELERLSAGYSGEAVPGHWLASRNKECQRKVLNDQKTVCLLKAEPHSSARFCPA